MKKLSVWVLTLVIVSLLTALELNAQSGAAKGKGRLKGKVTDTEGNPLEDVTIRFSNDKLQTGFELKSDKKGEWIIMGIAAGTWNMDFIKEGYKQKNIVNQVTAMAANKPVELSLEKQVQAPASKVLATPGMDLVREGNKLAESKDYQGAISKYEAALQQNPNLSEAYMYLAGSYASSGNNDKAIEAYGKFLAIEPDNVDAKARLAMVWLQKGNVEEAKKILSGVDLSSVNNPYLLYNLGGGFYNAQNMAEAIQCWEQAIAQDPKMVDAQFQLALAYYANKDIAKAKAAFQKVIELDPGSENAKMSQEMLDTMKE